MTIGQTKKTPWSKIQVRNHLTRNLIEKLISISIQVFFLHVTSISTKQNLDKIIQKSVDGYDFHKHICKIDGVLYTMHKELIRFSQALIEKGFVFKNSFF